MNEKILIVNFGAFGDIINSTPIAKHYKTLNKNNIVKWITRNKYADILKNNDFIDDVLTIEEGTLPDDYVAITHKTRNLIHHVFNKEYKIIYSAPYMSPKYDGTSRSTLLQITKDECSTIDNWSCDFIPSIKIGDSHIQESRQFSESLNGDKKVLVEYESFSAQSPFNEKAARLICEKLNNKNYDLVFSGKLKPNYFHNLKNDYKININHYSGSFLSNAELYNTVDYYIGCSSGITCLTHIDYCNDSIPRVELCNGPHWSTLAYTHMKNKKIVYNMEDFSNALDGIII